MDKKKIFMGIAAIAVLAVGILIGCLIMKNGDSDSDRATDASSEKIADGSGKEIQTTDKIADDTGATGSGSTTVNSGEGATGTGSTTGNSGEGATGAGSATGNSGEGASETGNVTGNGDAGTYIGTDTGAGKEKDGNSEGMTGARAAGQGSGTGNGVAGGNDSTSGTGIVSGDGGNGGETGVASGNGTTTGNGGETAGTSGNGAATGDGSGSGNGGGKAVITSALNTGNLTEEGSGYEGTKGTGKYNYGEALQKSLLFYELQRSGDLPENVRCNWRGDSALKDGSDAGIDLTGGWYDAGDNVKFNLPMAYTAAMLGWSIYEDKDAYTKSGQLQYALSNIKWANDYFIKCHPSDEVYYYQVGNGNQDHSYWGAAETVEYRMDRPSYKVTKSSPGSAVCGETAASLAICSVVYKDIDKGYSDLCLKHAKSLYKFARDTKSDAGYTAANGFYDSWSGFYDELAWSGAWLYIATGDSTYLTNAKSDFTNAGHDSKWAMCWDDVHIGAAVMLAKLTNDSTYTKEIETHLDWWSKLSSDHITYSPKGLAWLDTWGSLRYATTTAYIAAVYADWSGCPDAKALKYQSFAESQVNYALGSSGRSYVVGFGVNPPENPHHRTAQGSYCDNMNEPNPARHTLYGALVGGPDASDGYTDTVSDYNKNEVACDYNAGFTGILAKMYKKYGGQTIKNFGAVEKIDINEFYVNGGINASGNDFIEIKANICNVSAWPARVPKNLEFRYYIDLSEVYTAGGSASDIAVTTNYMAAGKSQGLKCWDEDKHIYYLSVDFTGDLIYPGGQDKYKKEIQVRLRNPKGTWDNSNDPSYSNMSSGGNALLAKTALYENGKLVFGTEPAKGKNAGSSVLAGGTGNGKSTGSGSESGNGNGNNSGSGSESGNGNGNNSGSGSESGNGNGGNSGLENGGTSGNGGTVETGKGTAVNESLSVKVDYANMTATTTSLQGIMDIVNESDGSIQLKDIKIEFYFTNEEKKSLSFDCYHAAVNTKSGAYKGLNGCSGAFTDASGKNTDTLCTMTFDDSMLLGAGDKLTVNFCIHHSDWSNLNTANDYSVASVENIVIYNGTKKIFGDKPSK